MLQIGIISDRIDAYTYKVRIPIYDKIVDDPTSINTEDLPEAVISAVPGMTYGLAVNDSVIIGFLNDELDKRVILGQLSRDTDSSSETVHSEVESQIQAVNTAIDILNDKDVYTHAKFSDDGGKTFTTLFDVSNIEDNGDTCSSIKELNIGKSKRVNWSIMLDGVSVDKDRFPITTYLTMGDITKSFKEINTTVMSRPAVDMSGLIFLVIFTTPWILIIIVLLFPCAFKRYRAKNLSLVSKKVDPTTVNFDIMFDT